MMRKINFKKGMSLVETLVAMSIFVVILLILTLFQKNIIAFNKFSKESITSASDARAILRTMIKEIRSASPGSNGVYPIEQTSTSTLVFYSDSNDDGLKERIRYSLVGTMLYRGSVTPSGSPVSYNLANESVTTLATDIKNSTSTAMFEYFDNSYAGTSTPLVHHITPTAIRMIRVNLYIEADPNKAPIPRLYTSQGMLRNLKDNL